jgi:polar amino acid transport system substrate-binding protein
MPRDNVIFRKLKENTNIMQKYFLLLNLLVCFFCQGQIISGKSTKTLEIITGLPKPPFILEGAKTGLQLDLFRAALSPDYLIDFLPVALGRNITSYQRMHVNGIATIQLGYQHPNMYISKPYINYQNVAISLTESNFSISSIDDLSGKSVAAFQNARKFLTDDFSTKMSYLLDYREVADQMKQISMLYSRRTEVIVLDYRIFKYFLRDNVDQARYKKPVAIHYIFDKVSYSAGFDSKELCEQFDRGIVRIKKEGIYQEILDRYLE